MYERQTQMNYYLKEEIAKGKKVLLKEHGSTNVDRLIIDQNGCRSRKQMIANFQTKIKNHKKMKRRIRSRSPSPEQLSQGFMLTEVNDII